MNILKKWFKQFSDFLFNANYWDQVPDTCRETFQKDLYDKVKSDKKESHKNLVCYYSGGNLQKKDHTDNFKFEPVQITKEQKEVMLESLNQPTELISPSESFRNSAEKEYFDDKIITPLSDQEKEELNTLFAEEILPYATLDKTFEEPHVTSGYLHIDDPIFVNAATSYVDNSQKVEHQLDEQKSDEIKTKKNKRKYNKNKKK